MTVRRGAIALLAAAALTAAGCGSDDADDAATNAAAGTTAAAEVTADAPAANGTETVFDEQIAGIDAGATPAVEVPVGGGKTVSFDEGEKLKVAYVGYGLGFDYTVPQYEEAKRVAADLGIELDTFDPAGDGQKQVSQLQDIMSGGKYNAVITYPVTADLTCDLLSNQLPAKGIIVVSHNQAACTDDTESTDGVLSTVWDSSAGNIFELWSKRIADAQDGPQKAIVITGAKTDTTSNKAVKAIEDAFAGKDIEILAVQRTDYTTPDAQQKAQDALQAHPDATLVLSTFPEGTRGIVSAARIAGKEGKLKIYDLGGSKNAIEEIRNGNVAGSTPQYPATVVRSALQAVALARAGEEVPSSVPLAGVKGLTQGEAPWVDESNADSFQAEF